MCVLFIAWKRHPRYRVILAANRDEFHDRPASPAGVWPDMPNVAGGRDLLGGGSWLAVRSDGCFAAVTNVREPASRRADARSRGELVQNFASTPLPPVHYARSVSSCGDQYNGFNLLLGDADSLVYACNRHQPFLNELSPGIYGLSNGRLDSLWPKVIKGKQRFEGIVQEDAVDPNALLDLLYDRDKATDSELPDTGIGLEWERLLSPIFIQSPLYGTRASTVLLVDHDDNVTLIERSFKPDATAEETRRIEFSNGALRQESG
ncbi:MAG: NRDE family protein [Pseudomonadota bacterium]|nr:NRDE family protein [Pseudomonadota bacterium]